MTIEHVAIWARDLEALKDFYVRWFGARANDLYENRVRGFRSYFLVFGNEAGGGSGVPTGARLELMEMPGIVEPGRAGEWGNNDAQRFGLAHFAMKVGSREAVTRLTEDLRRAEVRILSEPRQTGDGYFESCILDPEGNRVEITA